MPKDDWVYIGHMLDMSLQARAILSNKDRTAYDHDIVLQLALTHIVQVIGEAAQQVSKGFQDSHPQVPWREIIGMRHRIVHDYLNVDEDVVWEVVNTDLPRLVSILEGFIPPEYR
ncbi:MAG TPA: HepT-like ribonuclease domain-containing protein [Anaerolineaceae bacterium]